jgi:hypothetical protein
MEKCCKKNIKKWKKNLLKKWRNETKITKIKITKTRKLEGKHIFNIKWFKLPQLSKMSIGLWDLLLR